MTGIVRGELVRKPCRETRRAEMAQIVVEVAELGAKHEGCDPGFAGSLAEMLDTMPACGVRIGRNVETPTAGREDETREVVGRSRGGSRQRRHHGAERGHSLEAFAGGHDRDRGTGIKAEPDAVAKQMTKRAAWIVDMRFTVAARIQPGTLQAGDTPVQVRDSCDKRWQGSRLTGEKIAHTSVDGCGAPVHAITLTGLARGIHRIGSASERSPFALHRVAGALVRAVRENPWTIAGPGEPDTIAIETLGVFAKGGAEGVMVMVAPNGATVALKMLDGNGRAATIVAATLLARAGALTDADVATLTAALPLSVLGGGQPVGAVRVAPGV